jgi:hypothetical protein
MIDIETDLSTLYVMVDDYGKCYLPIEVAHPGPSGSLSRSEVVTLAMFGQWSHFSSERDFYRYTEAHLRWAFPGLPDRSQFNRLQREHRDAIVSFGLYLVQLLRRPWDVYELLDSTAVVTRDAKRRGAGWLAGQADIGWRNRVGWYEGMHLLTASRPDGLITGFGFAPASTNDHSLAETFLAVRHCPTSRLYTVGSPTGDYYVADKGFAGANVLKHWWQDYAARLVCPPHQKSKREHWPKALRRWLSSLRQVIESVYDKLLTTFRLARERPHALTGLQARLAAKVALHNFCLWFNRQLGREPLAFAELLTW